MPQVPRKRPCRYCRRWFLIDPRLGDRHRTCPAPACQARRQAANEEAWLDRHPGYFRGRRAKHATWRSEHPDAKRLWRAAHPEAREREVLGRARRRREAPSRRAVEQEARALQLVGSQGVGDGLSPAVEQKSMTPQVVVLLGLASGLPPAVEQKSIAGALLRWHDRGRLLLEGAAR